MTSKQQKPSADDMLLGEVASDAGKDVEQRWDLRRKVFLGENIRCWLETEDVKVRVEVVDLSSRGLGVIPVQKDDVWPARVGEVVTLRFNASGESSFTVLGEIRHIRQVKYLGDQSLRLGLRLATHVCGSYSEFTEAIPGEQFDCKTYIRPQVSCRDPFFFMEWLLFQVNGFTAHGIDLVVSARCKTLLPNQPLDLDVFIPCHGRFKVPVTVSPYQYSSKKNRYRLFMAYRDVDKRFLEAVSEYLLVCNPDATPNVLRAAGFQVGHLDQSFHISHPTFEIFKREQVELYESVFGVGKSRSFQEPDRFEAFSRRCACRVGRHLVASFRLIYVGNHPERSEFVELGHTVPERVFTDQHIEVSSFYVTDVAKMADFFLPMLRHIVRMAAQARFKYILLQCTEQIWPVLESIGFIKLRSVLKQTDDQGEPMDVVLTALKVNQILVNQDDVIAEETWQKLYRDLNIFLNRRLPKPRLNRPFLAPERKKKKKKLAG